MHFDFTELLAVFFLKKRYENLELFAYIAWLSWNERNNCWHGKVACSHPEVVSKATALLEKFKELNKRGKQTEMKDGLLLLKVFTS